VNPTTVENILLAILPFICLLAAYIYKLMINKMPSNVLIALQQIAPIAVHTIEQMYGDGTGQQKKDLAIQLIIQMLKESKLPTPSLDLLNAAVEYSVLLMNQMPQIMANKEDHNPLAKPLTNETSLRPEGQF